VTTNISGGKKEGIGETNTVRWAVQLPRGVDQAMATSSNEVEEGKKKTPTRE